jgi:hypothetical protein
MELYNVIHQMDPKAFETFIIVISALIGAGTILAIGAIIIIIFCMRNTIREWLKPKKGEEKIDL